jgi:prepilin-type N-terminal cleavage/methylation domain-containing protein
MLLKKSLVRSFSRRGFTLIELLIVIAIILILISIALPNFLEAQLRAKVTKAEAEIRSVGMTLEMYRTDSRRYPPAALFEPTRFGKGANRFSLMLLTTPILYLLEIPQDPFCPIECKMRRPSPPLLIEFVELHQLDRKDGHGFVYWTPVSIAWPDPRPRPGTCAWVLETHGAHYGLASIGPDRDLDWYDTTDPCARKPDYGICLQTNSLYWYYSPTNGTNSNGDVVRRRP